VLHATKTIIAAMSCSGTCTHTHTHTNTHTRTHAYTRTYLPHPQACQAQSASSTVQCSKLLGGAGPPSSATQSMPQDRQLPHQAAYQVCTSAGASCSSLTASKQTGVCKCVCACIHVRELQKTLQRIAAQQK